jgi:hypothetical protein
MSWDFAIYPEITDAQKCATFEVGLTLLCIQASEHILTFTLSWVFPRDPKMNLRTLYAQKPAGQKKTLGSLLKELRKRVDVRRDFNTMLLEFLELRNRFVHRLFHERDFSLGTDESCVRASEIMLRLQCLSWEIQHLLMGYVIVWLEQSGVPKLVNLSRDTVNTTAHFQQVRAHFQQVLRARIADHPNHPRSD